MTKTRDILINARTCYHFLGWRRGGMMVFVGGAVDCWGSCCHVGEK